jgi:hypothetical protein
MFSKRILSLIKDDELIKAYKLIDKAIVSILSENERGALTDLEVAKKILKAQIGISDK